MAIPSPVAITPAVSVSGISSIRPTNHGPPGGRLAVHGVLGKMEGPPQGLGQGNRPAAGLEVQRAPVGAHAALLQSELLAGAQRLPLGDEAQVGRHAKDGPAPASVVDLVDQGNGVFPRHEGRPLHHLHPLDQIGPLGIVPEGEARLIRPPVLPAGALPKVLAGQGDGAPVQRQRVLQALDHLHAAVGGALAGHQQPVLVPGAGADGGEGAKAPQPIGHEEAGLLPPLKAQPVLLSIDKVHKKHPLILLRRCLKIDG